MMMKVPPMRRGRGGATPGSSSAPGSGARVRDGEASARGPAPRPCPSCPYRLDVPSGVWSAEEYRKLEAYDRPTWDQPGALFLCHQTDAGDPRRRVCAGWVGCHGDELLALRLAAAAGRIDPEEVLGYRTSVALFDSGTSAAAHGQAEIEWPGAAAAEAIAKVSRRRGL